MRHKIYLTPCLLIIDDSSKRYKRIEQETHQFLLLFLLLIQLDYTAIHVPITGIDSSQPRLLIL